MNWRRWQVFLLLGLLPGFIPAQPSTVAYNPSPQAALGQYVVLGWNDLGMHCMNKNYAELCILPPFNNVWCYAIKRGARPEITSQGVTLSYRFPTNTYSAGKVDFWTYAPSLFGVTLPANVGLTGHGLTGVLDWNGSAFEVTGVPITPFEDAAPTVEQPYQLVEVTLKNTITGAQLDQTNFVVPTSVEIHCDTCHHEDNETPDYNILKKHDEENHTSLRSHRPVLCASCHSSNALGTPGVPGVKSLSQAVHGFHAGHARNITCYSCHPGNQTQCLRGAMFIAGKTCVDCHGSLSQVASSISQGRRPWLDEPKCGSCHDANHSENPGKLYRNSTGHGGLYCTVCHGSPHAELPTAQARDGLQMTRVQGQATYLKDCTVCHITVPTGAGPHGFKPVSSVEKWATYYQ
ncbi:MAG: hypothetical protein K1X53_10780 [Candidatus Sumerlaeaceae bacterium]|nr:hypothetical protein [Candidatus Sumerlaeaceae bacterium]